MLQLLDPGWNARILTFSFPVEQATVIERVNRFVVSVRDGTGSRRMCHLHDPGRLTELIYPGNRVLIRDTTGAVTDCSITASRRVEEWVLTDSRFHSKIASSFFPREFESEVRVGKSRIDFRIGGCFVEVKGCTLVSDNIARFPDSPSKRASRHLLELMHLREEGFCASILVLVFSDSATVFKPNWDTDPTFASNLERALHAGVEAHALRFHTDENGVFFRGRIPVRIR